MFEDLGQAYLPQTRWPRRMVDRDKCEKCLRCIDSCPTAGFEKDEEGFPVPVGYGGMDQACLNCWNCVAVCPSGALTIEGPYQVPAGRYRTLTTGEVRFPDPLADGRPWDQAEPELTDTEKLIYKRRSNRLFKKKPVPKHLLHRIVEAGRFAPSAGNCQPYKFIVVTDRALINEVEKGSMEILRRLKNWYLSPSGRRSKAKAALFTAASLLAANKLDPRPFTAMEKADRENNVIYWGAPAVIFICKNPRGISNPDLDCGIAAQNMVLTAHSLGLGTCYIGLSIEPLNFPNMAGTRKKLGITPPWKAITSIAIGWPRGKIDKVVKRDSPPVEWIG
ncbi:MAG: nitroreductase family protein [Deltaproteobacteria bacterium]|nr:nitroreductase family protein [Deltaproteobacteria bacterium]